MIGSHSQSANGLQMPDGTWKREGPPIMMVPLDSARQWYPREEFVACNADHSQIAKLKRGENSIYPSVRWAIKKALLSAGDLYSEVKGTHHSYTQHLRSVDELSTMNRSLLEASHRQVLVPSNERLLELAPLPSSSRSENAINQKVKDAHQMKVDQSNYHRDAQSDSNPLNETIYQWQSSIEDRECGDTHSTSIPTDRARTDLTSTVLDDSFNNSKSTEPATSSVAEAKTRQKPEGDLNPDSAKPEFEDVGLASFQPEALKSATSGAKSMVFDEKFQSVIAAGDEAKTRECLAGRYYVNCKANDGTTPLLLAARHRHEIIVKMLLEQGANPGARDVNGQTTLHQLTGVQGIPIPETLIDLLLKDRPPLEVSNSIGSTPLMEACGRGEYSLATKLISHGANIDARNLKRSTPLHFAARYGSADMVSLLLANGAELEAKCDNDITPLHYAVIGNSTDTIERLLLAGADGEATIRPRKHTPLMVAIQESRLACAARLLKFGVNVDASNSMGETPLQVAARKGQLEMVKMLLDHGANPDACDYWDSSSLHDAARGGHLGVVKVLLDRGANPTIRRPSMSLFGEKPSTVRISDAVTPAQKKAVRALLKDAEKAWKRSCKK